MILGWVGLLASSSKPVPCLAGYQTKDGDDYKAGAVEVSISTRDPATDAEVTQLLDLVVGDPASGNRAKDVPFERSGEARVVGRLAVIPL